MNCVGCKNKNCRIKNSDCTGFSKKTVKKYFSKDNLSLVKKASLLTDDGRAGSLSRVEEVVEFIKNKKYKKIGIAYCYGMENFAKKLSNILKTSKIKHNTVCCTVQGLKEKTLDSKKKKETVSCNPIGQAEVLNKSDCDFVIELGLCLGHDVLFHRYIKCDFTVLVVKDRKFNHCPLLGFKD